jgi:hypothetical protein
LKGTNWILETDDFRTIIENYLENETSKENNILKTINHEIPKEVKCPFEEVKCEFPWKCWLYVDTDQNKICDKSE